MPDGIFHIIVDLNTVDFLLIICKNRREHMRSKAAVNKKTDKNYVLDALYKLGVFAFWIIIWQIASCIVNAEVILPSPMTVLTCFIRLIKTQIFLKSTLSSIGRIMSGYICAVAVSFIAAIMM